MDEKKVYGIIDIWHPTINGGETPEIRSDHKNFEGDVNAFFGWCCMHGAEDKWYPINEK